jgi:hypothetical protein
MGSSLGGQASSNFIEIDIDESKYKRPDGLSGAAGDLVFSRVKLSWDDMNIYIKNLDDHLNARMKLKPTYLKFKTKSLTLTMPLKEESAFFQIDEMELKKSKVILNQTFFNFDGELFKVTDGNSKLGLDRFNIYCKAPSDIDMTSDKGIIHGCLTEAVIDGQGKGDLAGAEVEYRDRTADDNDIYLKTRMKKLDLHDSKFTLDLNKSYMKLKQFEIETGPAIGTCLKDPDLISIDPAKLEKVCLNSIDINVPRVKVSNLEQKTKFFLDIDSFNVTNGQLNLKSPMIQIADRKDATNLKGVDIRCVKSEDTDIFDVHSVVADCIKDSDISMSKVYSDDVDGLYESYDQLFEDNQNIGDEVKRRYSDAYKLKARIRNKKLKLETYVKVASWIPKFKFKMEADIVHKPEKGIVIVDIKKYEILKIIRWRWFLRLVIKKKFVNDTVKLEGNKVILSL